MSDPIVPDPASQTPPAAPAAPVYAPAQVAGKRVLSLTSFILGLVAVVLFLTNWIAIVIGIVAVVLGFIAKAREPEAPGWMWLVGVIAGFVGIALGAIILIGAIALITTVNNVSSN